MIRYGTVIISGSMVSPPRVRSPWPQRFLFSLLTGEEMTREKSPAQLWPLRLLVSGLCFPICLSFPCWNCKSHRFLWMAFLEKAIKDFKYVSSVMFLESVTCYQSLVRVSQWQYDTGMEDQICIKVAVPAEKGMITVELLSIFISFHFFSLIRAICDV